MRSTRFSALAVAAMLLAGSAASAAQPPPADLQMVGDIDAGRLYIEDATVVGDDFAFLGTRGPERLSLRWFDASRERERRLAVVRSGDMPRELATAPGGVIFTGYRERQGTEPWRSDGTRGGTRLIREIHRGRQSGNCAPAGASCPTYPAGSDPQSFVTIGETTFFVASHPKYGRELWRTDGTRKGTRLVKDIRPGPGSALELGADSLAVHRDRLYFVADDGKHGRELWRTDGTRKGTRMVRDIGPGESIPGWVSAPVAAGDDLYFVAARKAEGLELWRTDGTRKGTKLVRDIERGSRGSEPDDLTAVGRRLYFTARDQEHGRELWTTDGTNRGTTLVADLSPGSASSDLGDLVALGDALYFTAWGLQDEYGRLSGLWRTTAAVDRVEPVMLGADGSVAADRRWSEFPIVATHAGRLYLTADDHVHGNEVWMIDGTTGASTLVADIRPGPRGSRPEWLMVAATVLYLAAADGEHDRQLWSLPLTAPTEATSGA